MHENDAHTSEMVNDHWEKMMNIDKMSPWNPSEILNEELLKSMALNQNHWALATTMPARRRTKSFKANAD